MNNDLSDEAICEYANSKVTDKYDQFEQAFADGVEHGMLEARRRAEANRWLAFSDEELRIIRSGAEFFVFGKLIRNNIFDEASQELERRKD